MPKNQHVNFQKERKFMIILIMPLQYYYQYDALERPELDLVFFT